MCTDDGAYINAGGSIRYDFILPFDWEALDIIYQVDLLLNSTNVHSGVYKNREIKTERDQILNIAATNAVVNTDIEYSAASGVMVDGSYNYIENNFVDKTGYGVTYHSGINIGADHIDDGFTAGGHQIY